MPPCNAAFCWGLSYWEVRVEPYDVRKRVNVAMAFDRLCGEKDYDDIGIQDICNASGLSRSTFYREFSSKFEIFTWYQDLLLDASVGQLGITLSWEGAFCAFHSGWLLFPSMNLAAKQCAGLESVEVQWVSKVYGLLLHALERKEVVADPLLLFQARYFSIATRPQSKKAPTPWVDELYGCTPEEYGRFMASIVPGDLYRLLNTPERPNNQPKLTLSKLFTMG